MSDILYNFSANNSSLDDIAGRVGQIQNIREDIKGIFQTLQSFYGGQGSDALVVAANTVDTKLDEVAQDMQNTQSRALDQQNNMQALDQRNAAQF